MNIITAFDWLLSPSTALLLGGAVCFNKGQIPPNAPGGGGGGGGGGAHVTMIGA